MNTWTPRDTNTITVKRHRGRKSFEVTAESRLPEAVASRVLDSPTFREITCAMLDELADGVFVETRRRAGSIVLNVATR